MWSWITKSAIAPNIALVRTLKTRTMVESCYQRGVLTRLRPVTRGYGYNQILILTNTLKREQVPRPTPPLRNEQSVCDGTDAHQAIISHPPSGRNHHRFVRHHQQARCLHRLKQWLDPLSGLHFRTIGLPWSLRWWMRLEPRRPHPHTP